MPDGIEKALEVMQNTQNECYRQMARFEERRNIYKSILYKNYENMNSLGLTTYLSNLLTNHVSNPVYQHFKYKAPEYLKHIKAEHRSDDGWITWAQKGTYNAGVDVVAKYAHLAFSPIQLFLRDIAKKMPKETFDSLNPANLLVLSMHYPLVQKYFAQRVDQLTTPIQYYNDFQGSFQKSIIKTKGAFANLRGHIGELEGGPMARTVQLSKVIVDMTEQSIAGKIGVALALFTLYQVPTFRQRTNASFNTLFPKGTMWGFFARSIPVRFIFSKPLAKIHGNPMLSFTVVTYMVAMSMAKTIQDSLTLKEKHSDIYERLQSYDREVVNAPLHLKYRDTLEDLRKK